MYTNTESYELTDNTFNFSNEKQLDNYNLSMNNNRKTNRNESICIKNIMTKTDKYIFTFDLH